MITKVKKYLELLGERIDDIMARKDVSAANQESMVGQLWEFVSQYSHLPGERLMGIYKKLKEEREKKSARSQRGHGEGSHAGSAKQPKEAGDRKAENGTGADKD